MTIGIIGAGNIGTAFARALATARHRRHHRQQPRPGHPGGTGRGARPDDHGRHARGGGQRRHRARRGQLVEAARRAGGPAGLGRPHRHRRQQPDRGAAVQARRTRRPPVERGRSPTWCPARAWSRHSTICSRICSSGDPRAEGGRRVLFYSGDDAAAKAEVGALIERLGFFGIDLGSLAVGGAAGAVPRRAAAGAQPGQVRLIPRPPRRSCRRMEWNVSAPGPAGAAAALRAGTARVPGGAGRSPARNRRPAARSSSHFRGCRRPIRRPPSSPRWWPISVTARTIDAAHRVAFELADEAAVDLDQVHRQVLEVTERGHAGAEIVQREAAAERAQALDEADDARHVAHRGGLGDLEAHARAAAPRSRSMRASTKSANPSSSSWRPTG